MASSSSQSTSNYAGITPQKSQVVKEHSQKAAAIAKEQITSAAVIAREAAYSGAYIWPIQGQYHFLTHPTLLKPVLPAILSATLFTICVTIALFVFTYLPTVAVLAFVSGPLAFFTAIPVILGEGAAIGIFVAKAFWLGSALESLFDEVLLRQGLTKLVSRGRELQSDGQHGKRLGKVLTKPLDRFSKENIIRWLISLPLNAIPVVGPAAFFLYNGAKSGPSYHARYFQLKSTASKHTPAHQDGVASEGGVSVFNKDAFVQQHRGSYSAFGATAMALNVLIPGGAIFCIFGNQVGAALWAAELEKRGGSEKKSE
ncbi:SubName: Full=Uncharacterized protein {ECO:0000313/EMBL:CCA74090.1} [Serendipita indica DSM 11827]|uniref:Outer spore wall protein RRT8 n=1 Tax=Serendipita indica (strain DSM 11827) TaxID=1109443 RepID=G4TRZ7_SERID|nr:SubName: Full=Uncharacterized protein {ECO:0000313/EMBL:CCA74090.1} [Serendipita indica DSM 11827]CCA74090.1 hypothetical protein PIIN_08044 [Serendipita indica DSM 11827]